MDSKPVFPSVTIMRLESKRINCCLLFDSYFLLEQQHTRTSFLWTEEGVSDLAAPPVDHGATLQDPGELSFISPTDTGERVRVTNAVIFPSASVDEEEIAGCCGPHHGWLGLISLFLVSYVYLMHLQ